MHAPIRTKMHILAENVDPRTMERGSVNPVVAKILAAHSYVIDKAVFELSKTEAVLQSTLAICKAGHARLPVSPMVVEFRIVDEFHEFVYLEELPDGRILSYFASIECKNHTAMVHTMPLTVTWRETDILISGLPRDETEYHIRRSSLVTGIGLALFMLFCTGIERERVESTALNKARVARGKPAIPAHTVVTLGRVYSRSGTSHAVGTGTTMRVHVRQAHVRRQHYGPKNEHVKTIVVPMCLVNYDPESGDEPPKLHRVVKA